MKEADNLHQKGILKGFNVKDFAFIGIFAAVTAICAQITVYLPFLPVPFSMSLLAVFICGGLLGRRRAFITQLVYLLLGAFGLPVFAGFNGGAAILLGPTGGYLWSYAFMAAIVGYTAEKSRPVTFLKLAAGAAAALIPCYAFGSLQLSLVTGITLTEALSAGVLPFIVIDLAKAFGGAYICVHMRRAAAVIF